MVALTNIFFASLFALSSLQQSAGAEPTTMDTTPTFPCHVTAGNQNQSSLMLSSPSSFENSTGLTIDNPLTPTSVCREYNIQVVQDSDTFSVAESAFERSAVACARAGFGARRTRIVSVMQPGSSSLMGVMFAASWWPCIVLASKF
ncbi:hypothetical protein AB1N83_009987 [Pleurotus pulmonarius]